MIAVAIDGLALLVVVIDGTTADGSVMIVFAVGRAFEEVFADVLAAFVVAVVAAV